MKLLILFISVSLFFNAPLLAQEDVNDTIPQFLNQFNQKDSARIFALFQAEKYYVNRDFEKALPLIEEALNLSKKLKLKKYEAESLRRLASYYRRKGLYDKAIEYALNAKKISESLEDREEILLTNSTLSTLYRDQGYMDEALEINEENVKIIKNDPPSGRKARYYFDLGNTYRATNRLDESEQAYKEALNISEASQFVPGIMLLKLTLGQLYKVKDNYNQARKYLNEALLFYGKSGQKANIALIKYDLATIHSLEGRHAESIPLYLEALEIYEEIGKLYFIKDINQKLFIAYNITGELEKAKAANLLYNQMKDSLDSQEKKALIADMKTKYETEKLEIEKALSDERAAVAEAESRQNQLLFISALFIAILIAVSAVFYFARLKQKRKAELITLELKESQRRLALEKQYRDSELKALKAQMNPHFIFNVLNSIQEFIVLNEKDLAADYLATFAELIRSYLHFSNQGYITIDEEVDALEKYLQLESLRFEDKLNYKIEVDKANLSDAKIPTMVIQPYVENAIKHGLFNKESDQQLSIKIKSVNDKMLNVEIEDNGIGREMAKEFKAKKAKNYAPFAMEATINRLDLLNKKFDNKIGLDTIDLKDEAGNPNGTKVILNIPILN